ncbi:MAG: hypothetical protein JWO94_982, partial [Verrucomicrobiaceae bacterium]|nr:hypothetical protein [Verrucomicrobiaceae bacterium]
VETVAAGGGSICAWTPAGLAVGPHSAGSSPGPACYGKGGPLTITDVNLLLGRFDPARSPIPLDPLSAEARLEDLLATVRTETSKEWSAQGVLGTLLSLAVEHMADAIRKISVSEGYAPQEYALLAFGGAGPQHACAVAAKLGMKTILVPHHAGILSAVGLHEALPEAIAERQVLMTVEEAQLRLDEWIDELAAEARGSLLGLATAPPLVLAELRLSGQDTPVQIEVSGETLLASYHRAYSRLFGYPPPPDRKVELVSLRVLVKALGTDTSSAFDLSAIPLVAGPSLIQDAFSTLVVESGWGSAAIPGFGHVLKREVEGEDPSSLATTPELLRHRFHSLVEDMGALLKRTAISTNIRERLDFSCALLNAQGELVASAPHIPVHLGALGVCVRETMIALKWETMQPGDTYITNHPAFGGSHLPDVTLIMPVFDSSGHHLGFVANRAHHAEIGGMTPGSMPAMATHLAQEGVVIAPRRLIAAGESQFEELRKILTTGPYPTRNLADNLADLHAQLAACRLGAERLRNLGPPAVLQVAMDHVLDHSARAITRRLEQVPAAQASETMDDGAVISVAISHEANRLKLDFTGTSPTHGGNLNATRAIVSSAVLYVLRLMLQEDLPLNEGLIRPVELILPPGTMLNPVFTGDSERDPAVVGGNVEVSQRLVDTLIKAFHLQACSQGTMNNLLFGNEHFGYYETIAGGAGAGKGYAGASALHTHMTNTAITDPEILEQRYPVRLREFAIRKGSGGKGQWCGGDGVIREFEFLEPLTVSLLTQHRQAGPFGLEGGHVGALGTQTLFRQKSEPQNLPSSISLEVLANDVLRVETPGGGGFGLE